MKVFKFLFLAVMMSQLVSCAKEREERVTVGTLQISVSPSSVNVSTGTAVTLTATGTSAGANVTINPLWEILTTGLGTISPSRGRQVTFTAGSSAMSGQIRVSEGTVLTTVNVVVTAAAGGTPPPTTPPPTTPPPTTPPPTTPPPTTPPPTTPPPTTPPPTTPGVFTIYTDFFSAELAPPGAFNSTGDSILLSNNTAEFSEGTQSFRATFSVGGAGWVGWFMAVPALSPARNMSAYALGHLRFDIRTAHDIEIGIRSHAIDPGANTAKRFISSYIIPDGTRFQSVSIPIAHFVTAQPGMDLTQMRDVFIAAAIGGRVGTQTNQTFSIDNIRWTTN